MANYTYTRVEETVNKVDYDTWLTNLTSTADTKIIFYEELSPVDNDPDKIRLKVLIEVTS